MSSMRSTPGATIATGIVVAGVTGALAGATYGGIATGTLAGALYGAKWGAISGVVAYAGGAIGSGLLSELRGGSFIQSFLASGLASIAGQYAESLGGSGFVGAASRVVATAAVGGAAAEIGGGKFANGAALAGFLALFGEVHAYAAERTISLKRTACSQPGALACVETDGRLRIDGARDIDTSRDGAGKGTLLPGMSDEGQPAWYDSHPIFHPVRDFVLTTGEVHDWMNSINYNEVGWYISRGCTFNTAFDAFYNFPGMPIAAAVAAGSYASTLPLDRQLMYAGMGGSAR